MEWLLVPLLLGTAAIIGLAIIWNKRRIRTEPNMPYVAGFNWLIEKTRSLGLLILGGKGSGKSFAVGKDLCFRTFLQGTPQLLVDPTGALTDYFLDKLLRTADQSSPERQEELLKRVWYIDMAASEGWVTSWPLYYRLGRESLFEVAKRVVETMLRLDPKLDAAPVEGANALRTIGTQVGMILAALGLQISEAENLLQKPKQWRDRGLFDEAVRRCPESARAVTWFRQQYIRWKDEIQTRRSSSFRGKIEMYELDEVQRAIYGGSQGLDFEELCEQGVTVLVDFRHVLDEERLRWGMNIVFDRFLAFIRHRGLRQRLIHLCIDELSRMTNQDAQTGTDLFSQLLDTLLNVEARNRGVAVTLMIQGLWQVSEKLQATLLSCGNLMIGYQSDEESARKLAKHLFPYTGQPQVKRWEPVYAGSSEGPIQIDWRVVEYSLLEAEHLAANAFTQLPGFHFLVRPAVKEGTVAGPLLPMVVKEVGEWVDQEKVAALRRELGRKTGRPLKQVLEEIEARQHGGSRTDSDVEMKTMDTDATLAGDARDSQDDNLSNLRETIRPI